MKKIILCTGLVFLIILSGYAQKKKNAAPTETAPKNLLAILNFNAYYTYDHKPYIEFQFIIDGSTARYVPTSEGLYAAEIDIDVDIRRAGQEESAGRLHYILVSPQTRDSVSTERTYFSDVRNVALPNGDYYLYFKLRDLHGSGDTVRYIDFIHISYPDDSVAVSDISLYSRISHSGDGGVFYKYEMATTPLFQQYAPENIYSLPFSAEIYNTDKALGNGTFIVKAEIAEVGHRAAPEYVMTRNMKTAPASIFIHIFNIYMLPSGNYNLNLYVMDADSNIIATNTTFFQRSNPRVKIDMAQYDDVVVENTFVEKMTDLKQLQYDVSSLYPIGTRIEQEFFNQNMKKVPLEELQRYFYSFWVSRSPNDPEGAWLAYRKKIEYVNERYGSKVIEGFNTDRGRVYLCYGPPNTITEEPYDPQAYPYEIWHYYDLGSQTNVKFIFYNRDLVTNNYELLHSDYIGEIHDPAWQMKLVKRLSPNSNPDITTPDEYRGGHAGEYYKYNRQ